ncbi:MAG: FAD:protein FMN transferase [Candidatus Limnocylindrales bacterium]
MTIGASAAWRALGTTVHVLTTAVDVEPARRAVAELLDTVDATYSRVRPDSELSRLNDRSGQAVAVGQLLGDAIEVALRVARATDGAVDPTVGRAMRRIGYDDDFDHLVNRGGPIVLRIEPIPGWSTIRFDPAARTVHAPRGVELDLGSTGKALAADLAAAVALDAVGGGVLVSLGGDIASAGTAPLGGWPVLVADDSTAPPDSDGEVIALRSGAIATSSTTVRRWTRGGTVLHHLVDPATGLPTDGPWRTASVIAATCVDANAAATAAIVRGADALGWLDELGLASRLVSNDGAVRYVADWPLPVEAADQVGVGR